MSESFLAYSLSVITSRAIPDARDGLKPVQRRILYSMLGMGVRPDKPHRKSARVVGDTMGRYHPHGDAAIYDALVKLAQSFSRPITLVDPQGNFGTLDDPPAASRYTECKLSGAAMEMLDEINENTVDMTQTYDGESEEPVCLPARLPNLLVNGGTGIAVGMATNMAPHNLVEVVEAIKLVLQHKGKKKLPVEDLMAVIPGPDFPSGGRIVDTEGGIKEAYETGRGAFRVQARMSPVKLTRSRMGVEVTELPYNVGPEKVVKRINELADEGKLAGVHSARNLSDRSGLKLLIECQPNVPAESVYKELYKQTALEETFSINNVVLIKGEPRTVGLYELCKVYVEHRLEVIVRRSQHRLDKAEARLHIVEGLLIALDNIDEVVAIIRKSSDVTAAAVALKKKLKLSDEQAAHILDMQLRRLTALEISKLSTEKQKLVAKIAALKELLRSTTKQRNLLRKELNAVVADYGYARRTEIATAEDDFSVADSFEPATVRGTQIVTLSTTGLVGRCDKTQKRSSLGKHDFLISSAEVSAGDSVLALTSAGRLLSVDAVTIPEAVGRSRGSAAAQVFCTAGDETVVAVFTPSDTPVAIITAKGRGKRVVLEESKKKHATKQVFKLGAGDRLIAAFHAFDSDHVAVVSDAGKVLKFSADTLPVQGLASAGVGVIKLKDGNVLHANRVIGSEVVIAVEQSGHAVITELSEVSLKGRNGVGVSVGTKQTLTTAAIAAPTDLLIGTETGNIRVPSQVPKRLEAVEQVGLVL